MRIKKINDFLTEKLDYDDIKSKLEGDYSELKNGIIEMIEDSLKGSKESVNMIDIENFIKDYISSGKEANMIDGLIEDNDIFNFYLKYQTEIDDILNDKNYMNKSPKDNNVYSLYDVIIDGTKQSVLLSLEIINKQLFK